MFRGNYIDDHPLSGAFVANQLIRLADMISDQGEALLTDAKLDFPARAVSTVLLIGERGAMSAADIANTLEQPHQLVTQRVELLIKAGVIEKFTDPDDARRKILKLTTEGKDQFARLQTMLSKADKVFSALFLEVSCDLPEIIVQFGGALNNSSLLERSKTL
jgi:DNA-binding MarR family transcriptional regulator